METGQESMRDVPCCHIAKKSLTETDRCAGALSGETNSWFSIFLGAFPSYRIPKTTKDAIVHLFIYLFAVLLLQQI